MRKRAELSLENSSLAREKLEGRVVGGRFSELANYSVLFDHSRDAILLVDLRNYEILETNPAFRDLLQTDHSFHGRNFTACFGLESESEIKDWISASTANGRDEKTIDLVTASGVILEFSRAKVELADYCAVYQIIARDVTEERSKSVLLERQSLTDEMTGLSNFRSFRARLALEHERAVKKNRPYSIAFFDVDHFKHFNDKNGHPAGDDALRHIARLLREVAGRSEFLARYGGEEFVVLCANVGAEAAAEFAERARSAISTAKFSHGDSQPLGIVSVSIGVAALEVGETADDVLKRADHALYCAKQQGRNRVSVSVTGEVSEVKTLNFKKP
ncbi:MAG: sensor domain-containing diguanylate cyclase [Cryobacterium sp.]|nr:sensor domain-containing diguanylate cyclase [Oligoflexia bacterium]